METVFGLMDPVLWLFVIAVTLLAGFVKGAVGFAMPMIMISGIGSFLSPELALASLIIPTVLSNLMQTFRGGLAEAWLAVKRFRRYIVIMLVVIVLSAQLIRFLSTSAMFLTVGVPISLIVLVQLTGWRPHFRPEHRDRTEAIIATIAGAIGGLAGVWGPPTTAYLTAIETPKLEQIRIQGVIFGAGAVVLFFTHLRTGVLNELTLPFSALMVVPAVIGMMIGFRYQDRLDQAKFRRITLIVLGVAGLNLIRRGLMG